MKNYCDYCGKLISEKGKIKGNKMKAKRELANAIQKEVEKAKTQDRQQKITDTLQNLYPEVIWDRYSGDLNDLTVFGWLERKDQYKDYVELNFKHGEIESVSTSSAKMSAELSDRAGFNHSDCERVETSFDIKNCIRLTPSQQNKEES